MSLAPRRFPDTITRKRTAPGGFVRGSYQPGATTETELAASVQPLALEDSDLVGGSQLVERLKVYIPEEDALVAAADWCIPESDPARDETLDELVDRDLLTETAADAFRAGGSRADETQLAFAADDVVFRLATFTVEESRSWPGGHTRATVVRSS